MFSFFLLIYSRSGVPASWATRHTTVCLDITGEPAHTTSKERWHHFCLNSRLGYHLLTQKWSVHYALLSAMSSLLYSAANEEPVLEVTRYIILLLFGN